MNEPLIVKATPKKEDYRVVQLFGRKPDSGWPDYVALNLYDCQQTMMLCLAPHWHAGTEPKWEEGKTLRSILGWDLYWLYQDVTCSPPGIHKSTVDTD